MNTIVVGLVCLLALYFCIFTLQAIYTGIYFSHRALHHLSRLKGLVDDTNGREESTGSLKT